MRAPLEQARAEFGAIDRKAIEAAKAVADRINI